jgi:hypothetical protein
MVPSRVPPVEKNEKLQANNLLADLSARLDFFLAENGSPDQSF